MAFSVIRGISVFLSDIAVTLGDVRKYFHFWTFMPFIDANDGRNSHLHHGWKG